MIHGVYTAALGAALLVAAPSALYRRVRRGVPLRLVQRLGYLPPRAGRPCGWIHAVSVGESIAATPIVEGLRRLQPATPLVMTTVTETGARVVTERFAGVVDHRFFPLDLPGAVRRAVDAINPAFMVCLETELWPNVLRALARRGVPVMIANGRLSDRSYPRYRAVRRLLRHGPRRRAGLRDAVRRGRPPGDRARRPARARVRDRQSQARGAGRRRRDGGYVAAPARARRRECDVDRGQHAPGGRRERPRGAPPAPRARAGGPADHRAAPSRARSRGRRADPAP